MDVCPGHLRGQAAGAGLAILALAGIAAGCGASKHAASTSPATTASPTQSQPATTNTQSPGALQGESASAATGDIPDNQVFVTFSDPRAGYSMKYPEGWAQSGNGNRVAFRDKNNVVRVVVQPGATPTVASVRGDLASLSRSVPSLRFHAPAVVRLSNAPAVKVVYTTLSAPNAVTNKRVTLTVDRYYLAQRGKEAIVDLGTPVGVDNVDAYRLMIQSFRWR